MHKVILIEDDDTMRSLLHTLLEFEGFEVVPMERTSKLEEILEQLRKEKPALIFLDVHLKNLNGFDLVKGLRQDAALQATRVLMSSGMELSLQCRQAGADDFILKPFMPEELVEKIRSTIG
jgi:DNA-binding response OmpR family regulator